MTIGERIKQRRQVLGLTQEQLGEAIQLSPQQISAIEKGTRAPSLSSLAKLADELGVTIDYLVVGREGGVMDIVPAIKADKRLKLDYKRALITTVQAMLGGAEE